jgi:hypothetical protein
MSLRAAEGVCGVERRRMQLRCARAEARVDQLPEDHSRFLRELPRMIGVVVRRRNDDHLRLRAHRRAQMVTHVLQRLRQTKSAAHVACDHSTHRELA